MRPVALDLDGAAAWLEREGWEHWREGRVLRALRERGDRAESLALAEDGRLRYTVTRAVGEEEVRRIEAPGLRGRVVSVVRRETTITAAVTEGAAPDAIVAAMWVARGEAWRSGAGGDDR